jgi:hypothetical protein
MSTNSIIVLWRRLLLASITALVGAGGVVRNDATRTGWIAWT